MKNKKFNYMVARVVASLLSISVLAGCSIAKAEIPTNNAQVQSTTSAQVQATVSAAASNSQASGSVGKTTFKFSEEDYSIDWKSATRTTVNLAKGSTTITKSGIYELTGTLTDGSITVNVDKSTDKETVYLVLNGANITSKTATPISIVEAKNVVIILSDNTVNTVSQGKITTTDTEFPSAAIFSKADTTITGGGALTVTTQYNDGITSKDDLLITDGNITVNAVGDGIVGKDLLAIEKAAITVISGKDGMRATNSTDADKGDIVIFSGSFKIEAENDAIQAEKDLEIYGGTFDLTTGEGYTSSIKQDENFGGGGMGGGRGQMSPNGGIPPTGAIPSTDTTNTVATSATAKATPTATASQATTEEITSDSAKGLKANGRIQISDGTFKLSVYEDALHSAGTITIDGGNFTIESGDDAIHSDASIVINGGDIYIQNSYEGIESINIAINDGKINVVSSDDGLNVSDSSGVLTINGGEIYVKAGGDGIDSNGNILQSGGTVNIDTTTIDPADSAVDYDGTFTKTGGTIVDQSGTAIDTTMKQGFGGGGGMKGGGNRPDRG